MKHISLLASRLAKFTCSLSRLLTFLSALCLATSLAAAPAPDFTLTTSDGQVRKLYQDFVNQGKVVVIEAFFTSCPPCATHAPFFQNLYTQKKAAYPGKVEFLLLSTLQTDNNAKVATYLSDKMMTMPGAAKDGGSLTALQPYLAGQFGGFFGTPTFWVIAPYTGEVTFDVRGNGAAGTMTLLGQKIDEYLGGCRIATPSGTPINDVSLRVFGYGQPGFDTTFSVSGNYDLSGINSLKNREYAILPSKNGSGAHPLDGLSTYDLVLTSKHILGLDTFNQPWKIVAADLNCSGTVTTYDIVLGRRLILGIDEELPCPLWHFLPLPPPIHNEPLTSGLCRNFVGFKIGDLNGSYLAPEAEDRAPLMLLASDIRLRAGERQQIQLRTAETTTLAGLQLSLGFDPQGLRVEGLKSAVLSGFAPENFNPQRMAEGQLPIVWVNGTGANAASGATLLTLDITALRDGSLSEMLDFQTEKLTPEAVSTAGLARSVVLFWEKMAAPSASVRLSPNPARGLCYADFAAEHDGQVLVQMLDVQGRIVFEKTAAVQRGENRVELDAGEARGLFLVKIAGTVAGRVVMD